MREMWSELGESMRLLRRATGESLRQVEAESEWRRGTLSQVENGKTRPSQDLIDFYDARFSGDGMLRSLYAEAHAIEPVLEPLVNTRPERVESGDAVEIIGAHVATGTVVSPGATLVIGWTLRNHGEVPWVGRALARVGAAAGVRLICGPPSCPVPDTPPGHIVAVAFEVAAPTLPGTVTAHWRMIHRNGDYCFPTSERLALTVVVQ